ncbi:uncharacterized protein LOC141613565 [Silene latifolia]|uniref:uncharacterized protein LOC141613565 n=1 Tax=Silene latifolia TaxID=37657 RepID=UPI003D7730B5
MDLGNNLKELIVARDSFLTQKAKLQWSLEGVLNTSSFHHAIKKRLMLNKVFQIKDKDGVLCTEADVIQSALLDYYQDLLGTHKDTIAVNQNVVRRGLCCTEEHWRILTKTVSPEEVKQSIFSIPKGKSLELDGYSSQFYRDVWDVIGGEICTIVINFVNTGQLLAQILSVGIRGPLLREGVF